MALIIIGIMQGVPGSYVWQSMGGGWLRRSSMWCVCSIVCHARHLAVLTVHMYIRCMCPIHRCLKHVAPCVRHLAWQSYSQIGPATTCSCFIPLLETYAMQRHVHVTDTRRSWLCVRMCVACTPLLKCAAPKCEWRWLCMLAPCIYSVALCLA